MANSINWTGQFGENAGLKPTGCGSQPLISGKISGGLETPPGTHAILHLTHVLIEIPNFNYLTM